MIKKIRDFLKEKCNGELISDEYTNYRTKIKVKCENNHFWEDTWECLQKKNGCLKCIRQYRLKDKITTKIRERFGEGRLLTDIIESCYSTIEIECSKGHKYIGKYKDFLKHHNKCSKCTGTRK